ncbi:hypothetical protein AZI87_15415 [Bdellovibrio bacteriovorus]|uniref:Uncharacterized protein n=1 Tax=Bdellovibrio bacteriovorus TaxID=959 RepID=A0A162FX48_BDEBC|nr:hypothetical protein [Bdellovibrio bacteriovorus]KYG62675.1 hypothetical protein AZI87_15415 [Bdellovibrio bacteriovorus]
MLLMTRFLSVVIFLGLSWGNLAQAAPRCESVFLPTVLEVIQQIDLANNKFLTKGSHSVEEIGKDFSWLRRRKLRKLINNTDLQNFASDKALERYAIELGTVLFGKKDVVDRWIRQSKDQRLEESTVMLIKEKLLQEGLLKTWLEVRDPRDIGIARKSLDKLWTLLQHRTFEWLRIPLALPSMKNAEVPPELMYKIIRDGFKTHAEEARIALRSQNHIEAYNTFKKIYGRVIFGVLFALNVHNGYEQIQDYHNRHVDQTIQQIQEIGRQAENAVTQIKREQFDQAYKSAEAEFIKKWGEEPTPAEKEILRNKIAAALNMTAP